MEESQRECICTLRPSPEEASVILNKITEDQDVTTLCKTLEDVLNGNTPRTVLLCTAAILGASFCGMPNDKTLAAILSHVGFENMMSAHLNPKEVMWACADIIMKTVVLMEYITRFKMLVGDDCEGNPSTTSDWRPSDTSS